MLRRFCLTLDLQDEPALIKEYEAWHRDVWPEVLESLRDSGIKEMTIYRLQNRLCMIMEVAEHFSFEAKAAADLLNTRVQEWEELMWHFQRPLPWAKPGEKWLPMEPIFIFHA